MSISSQRLKEGRSKVLPAILTLALSLCWLGSACSAQPASPNLLWNSTFQIQTNPGIPDYWDLMHPAECNLQGFYNDFGIDNTVSSPISGTQVLKIVNSLAYFPYMQLKPTQFDSPLPAGTYTFSIYMRATFNGAPCTIYPPVGSPQSLSLSTGWQRYSITFPITGTVYSPPCLYFSTGVATAGYWVTAPQLEIGASASAFQPDTGTAARTSTLANQTASDWNTLLGLLRNPAPLTTQYQFITYNGKPFQIIGAYLPYGFQTWYLSDLVNHGFNTIFYPAQQTGGVYNLVAIKALLDMAQSYGLKVVIGPAMAGNQPANWQLILAGFCQVVGTFKTHPAVLGWWSVDEPNLWTNSQLISVYQAVKAADPNHFVMVNWIGEETGIYAGIGAQPIGTLASSDVYSFDNYPFQFIDHSLYGYAIGDYYVSRTANPLNKPSHAFLQLYAEGQAYREPTGAEINFMAFFALMNGTTSISYYDTKSNCQATWTRVGTINSNVKTLFTALFANATASQVQGPTLQGNFLYSLWKKGTTCYVIALNMTNSSGQLTLNVSNITAHKQAAITMLIDSGPAALVNGIISDSFLPYEAKVYTFSQ
jgi:hypothetical protein